ncbi:MAG: hypothetical protein ACRD1T_22780, partial [Acidimicrobiia bacterium]
AEQLVDLTIEHLSGEDGIVLLHSWPVHVPSVVANLIDRLGDGEAEFIRIDDPRADSLIKSARPAVR